MLYDYRCSRCSREDTVVRAVKDWTPTIECQCGATMKQVIHAPRVIPDIQPYKSIVTGERIKGRSHHRQHLKQHGLVEVGNEPIRERKAVPLPPVIPDLKRAIEEVKSR